MLLYSWGIVIRKPLESKNNFGRTPLEIACCSYADESIIRFLMQRRPETLEPPIGSRITTPLHRVCAGVMEWNGPCGFGAGDCLSRHYNRRNIFKCEGCCNQFRNLLRLLAVSDRAVQAQDAEGRTAFYILGHQGAPPALLHVLFAVMPYVTSLTDRDGRTALHATIDGWKEPA